MALNPLLCNVTVPLPFQRRTPIQALCKTFPTIRNSTPTIQNGRCQRSCERMLLTQPPVDAVLHVTTTALDNGTISDDEIFCLPSGEKYGEALTCMKETASSQRPQLACGWGRVDGDGSQDGSTVESIGTRGGKSVVVVDEDCKQGRTRAPKRCRIIAGTGDSQVEDGCSMLGVYILGRREAETRPSPGHGCCRGLG